MLTPVAASMVTDNDVASCSGRDNDKGCYDGSKQKVAKSEGLLWMPASVVVE